jgi:hypothetical protein
MTFDGSLRGASIFWPEVSLLGLHNMLRQVEHILRDFLVGNIVEILLLLPHFVGIAQRHAEHTVAARFERDDMLA